jgi:creatinine amidohydrolase
MTLYRLEELFPRQLEARLADSPILVLPFGTVEWHSHHLPLGLDGLVAQRLGEAIAEQADAVLAPASYWAVGGVPYPYTLRLPASIIEPLLVALFEQFGGMGFRVIVGFTGHFGLDQTLTLKRAALSVMRRSPVNILPLTEYDLVTDLGYTGDHAGIGESSLLWATRPDLVQLDSLPPETALDGVIGADPRGQASAAYGARLIQDIGARGAEMARRFCLDTPALARERYLDALELMVRVLDKTADQRQKLPRSEVPSIGTPAYLAACQAIYAGDYAAAKAHLTRKLSDLRQ